jgi:acyl-coenzyme A thioesterase PaaI-like protein
LSAARPAFLRDDAEGGLIRHAAVCMACGEDNPGGYGLRMWGAGAEIHGEVTLGPGQEGAPGLAHGGAVAAVLDDVLGSTTLLREDAPLAVTAHLEIDYRRPVRLGRPLTVRAWMEVLDGRKVTVAGELCDAGEVVAEARGLFLIVSPEHFEHVER